MARVAPALVFAMVTFSFAGGTALRAEQNLSNPAGGGNGSLSAEFPLLPKTVPEAGPLSGIAKRPGDGSVGMVSPLGPRLRVVPYPWKTSIRTTVFWVGEKAAPGNPVSNFASCWDTAWNRSFGGYDDPSPAGRHGYRPKEFVPGQNPFYIALPYNDVIGNQTKDSARRLVPWFREAFYREGRSVLKGRWVAMRRADRICYAQWEDCGPFETDDWAYVFGSSAPRTSGNGGAGLDVSPAVRDFLGFRHSAFCDWRFVDLHEVPEGPWKEWGRNNPFARRNPGSGTRSAPEGIAKLYELRDQFLGRNPNPSRSGDFPSPQRPK